MSEDGTDTLSRPSMPEQLTAMQERIAELESEVERLRGTLVRIAEYPMPPSFSRSKHMARIAKQALRGAE